MPHVPPNLSQLPGVWAVAALWVASLGCARDDTLKVFVEDPVAPEARITVPGDGQRFVKETMTTFSAIVSDEDSEAEELSVSWTSDKDGRLEGSIELVDGIHTLRTDTLSLGSHVITVEAIDLDVQSGTDTVEVLVVKNTPPQIAINVPAVESTWSDGSTVWVTAQVSDAEDEPAALRMSWTLDDSPVLSASSTPTSAGEATHGFEGLSVQAHTVGVTVTDAHGESSQATVAFTVVYGDVDGDGFISTDVGGDDCDDSDAQVHPDADEICDELDNDCDGLVDIEDDSLTGAVTGHLDGDGDGFGSEAEQISCDPSTLIEDDTDCDDTEPAVFPGAPEICNEIDDDCDGLVDGDDPDTDLDSDGHSVCDGDCDDEDADVHPDAVEVCDEVDNDCDGTSDGESALGAVAYYIDLDGDGYGSEDSITLACSEPAGHTLDTSDCNDGDDEIHPGAEEVCGDGIDNDCDGSPGDCKWEGEVALDEASHVTYGEDSDDSIASDLAAGDLDGDGLADLIIGAHRADSVAMNSGSVYLVPGPLTETWGSLESHASLRLDGSDLSDWAGEAITLGDLDDDGWLDLVVGAAQVNTDAGANSGAVYVHYGPLLSSGMLEDGAAVISGESNSDRLGKGLGTGDINGDGLVDLVMGSEDNNNYASDAGAVYIYLGDGGRLSGSMDVGSADTRLYSTQAVMEFGQHVLMSEDVNGDGLDDLLVAAPRSDEAAESAGAVYLFLGHSSDYELGSAVLHTTAQAEYRGHAERDYAGSSIASLGDVDGDGRVEFAIGAPNTDSLTTSDRDLGTVYLMLSPSLAGSTDLETGADVRLRGLDDDNIFGSSVAGDFDLDADGELDLAIGAPEERREWANQGVTYLLYGPLPDLPSDLVLSGDEDASFIGEAASDKAGRVVLGADLNDDGLDDLSIGAPGMTPASGLTDAGAIYVLFGGGM
jgi:hypothetical protein